MCIIILPGRKILITPERLHVPNSEKIATISVNERCQGQISTLKPIVCKYKVLIECESTSYELGAN